MSHPPSPPGFHSTSLSRIDLCATFPFVSYCPAFSLVSRARGALPVPKARPALRAMLALQVRLAPKVSLEFQVLQGEVSRRMHTTKLTDRDSMWPTAASLLELGSCMYHAPTLGTCL